MSVDYEKIGQAIGESQAKTLDSTTKSIEALRQEVGGILSSNTDEIRKAFDELAELVGKSDEALGREIECAVLDIENLVKDRVNYEEFKGQIEVRVAEIKDGETGEKGAQGEQGNDGIDRPLIEPVVLLEKDYPKNTLGTFNGGLWQSTKDTLGDPEQDPMAWHCLLDAMTTMSVDQQEDHTFKVSVRMATGQVIEDTFNIPYPEGKGIWEEGAEYKVGNIVTKGSHLWQAMQDTDQAPPGNGWQQILSAPRGKQGPQGKSIEGPQGKPGRNGLDGKDAEIDWDIQKVFVEGLIYTDERSASYPLRSFRGWFSEEESYLVGDVFRQNQDLIVVTQAIPTGSKYSQIAFDHTEIVITSGSGASTKAEVIKYMLWMGAWSPNTYTLGETVTDTGGTYVVVADQTTDRPAPSYIGSPGYVYDGTIGSDSDVASQVIIGNRYFNSSNDVAGTGYRIDTITDYAYSVYTVRTPTTTPVVEQVNSFIALTTGWKEFATEAFYLPIGEPFDVVVSIRAPDPAPDTFSGTWDYTTPANPKVPVDGELWQPDTSTDELWVAKIDDLGADLTIDLATLEIGDTITDGLVTWTIQSGIDEGTWWRFFVSPATQSVEAIKPFTFTRIAPKTTTYGVDTDYWLTAGSLNEGLHIADGIYEDIVPDENAYGVDILVQQFTQSPDWDVVAHGSGGASSASALDATETAWVQKSATPYVSGDILTTDNMWTEAGRLTIPDQSGFDIVVNLDGKRVDAFGFASASYGALVSRDGTISVMMSAIFNHMGSSDFRFVADGADVVAEVRGVINQDWSWDMVSYNKEIV